MRDSIITRQAISDESDRLRKNVSPDPREKITKTIPLIIHLPANEVGGFCCSV